MRVLGFKVENWLHEFVNKYLNEKLIEINNEFNFKNFNNKVSFKNKSDICRFIFLKGIENNETISKFFQEFKEIKLSKLKSDMKKKAKRIGDYDLLKDELNGKKKNEIESLMNQGVNKDNVKAKKSKKK